MFFGPLPVAEAEGAVLAHSQPAGERWIRKGRRLTGEDVAALEAAGVPEVVVARLEDGDLGEDEAARRLAEAAAGDHLSLGTAATGRVNLYAEADGLLVYDRDRLYAVNLVDESLTVAALTPYERVEPRQIVATVKVIPLGVPESLVARFAGRAADGGPLLRLAPFRPRAVGLLQTVLPGSRDKVLEKTTGTIRQRVEGLGGRLAAEERVPHAAADVAGALDRLRRAGADLILVLGASATTDRRDVIPAGIEAAGGRVEHYGMPVDPGNLLVKARLGEAPVLALPGSARSPKLGGNDWVLWRLAAGLEVTSEDIMRMGAGGLLKEIPTRPLPRAEAAPETEAGAARPARVAALVLAAGQSRRMGGVNKLLAEVDGEPMVRRAVAAAEASRARPVVVVTGHERAAVEAALAGREATCVFNPDYAEGLSTSLRRGLAALPEDVDGVVVVLGDMPAVSGAVIDRLIDAFDPAAGRAICVPTWRGKRGNPVLLARRFFPEMQEITGDVGAKPLLSEYRDMVAEVEMPDDGVLHDVDTPAHLAARRGDG